MFPEVQLSNWLKKYNLKVGKYKCPSCGYFFNMDIPMLTSDLAGLISINHGCGKGMVGMVAVPRTQKSKTFWRKIMTAFKEPASGAGGIE